MNSYIASQVSIATKHFINPNLYPQLTFTTKSSDFNATNVPAVEVEDGIYISDWKSLDKPSSLLKRTQSSASGCLS